MKKSFLFVSVVAAMLFVGCTGDKKSKSDSATKNESSSITAEKAPEPELLVYYSLPNGSEYECFKDKHKVSFIHIGTPISEIGKPVSDTLCIQLGDSIRDVEDIGQFIAAERDKSGERERDVCLMADREVTMGLIMEIKQQLRLANVSHIYYATHDDVNAGIKQELSGPSYIPEIKILPPGEKSSSSIKERNVLMVLANRNGNIMVGLGNEPYREIALPDLKKEVKDFVLNSDNSVKLPEKIVTEITMPDGSTWSYPVSQGIISFQCEMSTSYECYILVLNEIVRAFNEMRNELSISHFGKPFNQLSISEQMVILKAIPFRYNECEPRRSIVELKPQRTDIKVYSDVLKIVTNDEKVESEISFDEFDDDVEFVFPAAVVEEEIVREEIVGSAETIPSFQGGDLRTFHAWVQKNVKYPEIAQENGIQGRVLLSFDIEKDGSLGHIRVLQTPDLSLTEAAVQVLKKSPKWRPAMNKNKPVRISFTMPIEFRLPN